MSTALSRWDRRRWVDLLMTFFATGAPGYVYLTVACNPRWWIGAVMILAANLVWLILRVLQ